MMMAGLDGIQNKIHPGDAMDKDLYDLPAGRGRQIPTVCHALDRRWTTWTRTASS
jgi:glutamine synthetase